MTAVAYHRAARAVSQALHALIAVAIAHQVVTGLFLGPPRSTVARLHDIGGLISLGLLAAFWLWSLVRLDGAHGRERTTIDPADARRMFAASHHGEILRSDDGGGAWRIFGSP